MTFEDFSSHPAADRRTFNSLPVQICGAYEGSRNEDGSSMDFYPDMAAARKVYGDLPNPDGLDPQGELCKRFIGPLIHTIEGQLVIRYETLAARLRLTGHQFTLIDEYEQVLRANDGMTLDEQAASDREQAIQNNLDGEMSPYEVDAERLQDACDSIHQELFDSRATRIS